MAGWPVKDGRSLVNLSASFVAGIVLSTMAFIAWALVYIEIPKANETTLVQFVGALQALAGLIVGFFFGSSHTNKQQTETLDKLAETARVATHSASPAPPATMVGPGEQVTVEGKE